MQGVSSAYNEKETSLWRLAMATVARTVLLFTLPYLLAYYSVIGAWQGVRMLMLWLNGAR
jgi:hypothetical protein